MSSPSQLIADRAAEQNNLQNDLELELLIPACDTVNPELSVVIPAMNERITIADTVEWCKEGFAKAGVAGEVLIVDSSSDETPGIALAHGARVLRTPRRGLGRAYIDAIPYIRANYILMGDADCTYDFRHLGRICSGVPQGIRLHYGFALQGLY